jgi:hypothetical protein
MNCPVEGCPHVIEVHAHDDDEAVQKIMQSGKVHFEEMHPDQQGMSPEEMEKMTRKNMRKVLE